VAGRLLVVTSIAQRHGEQVGDDLENVRVVTLEPTGRLVLGVEDERQRAFDAASYDSLRILSTELKRILRDGGSVTVQLSPSRALSGERLASVLRLT